MPANDAQSPDAAPAAAAPATPRPRLVFVVTVVLATAAVAAASWFLLAWLRAPAIRDRLPPVPDLDAAAPALADQLRQADAQARRGLPSARRVGHLGTAYHASLLVHEAGLCYALANQLAPRDAGWPYRLGLLDYEAGRNQDAADRFRAAVALSPDLDCAWLRLGDALLKQDCTDEAREAYERARTWPVTHLHALLGLARAAEYRGDWTRIVALLEPLFAGGPSPTLGAPTARLLARAYQGLGRAEQAQALLDQPLGPTTWPPLDDPVTRELEDISCSATFLLKQATTAGRCGDTSREGRLLTRAVEVAPDDADAHLAFGLWCRNEAVALNAQGRQAEVGQLLSTAAAAARRSLELVPEQPNAHHVLAMALDMLGQTDEATAEYRQAIRLDATLADAHRRLGVLLANHDHATEGVSECRQAVTLEPQNADAMDSLGVALARAGQWEEAARWWTQSVKTKPASPIPHFNLVQALLALDRHDEALAQVRVLCQRHPGFQLAADLLRDLESGAPAPPSTPPPPAPAPR